MEVSCWKTEELSWRAETVSSALVVSEMLVGSQSRRAGGTLSARTEVYLEAVKANHVLFLLHSLGSNMCLRQLLQSSWLQRAWRAAFLKHVQGRHPGACRGTFGGRRKAVRDRLALQGGTGDFPGGPVVKSTPCDAGNAGSIPGQRRPPTKTSRVLLQRVSRP